MRRLILSLALCAALGGVQAAETLETAEADGIFIYMSLFHIILLNVFFK